jgi:hypothetical protein
MRNVFRGVELDSLLVSNVFAKLESDFGGDRSYHGVAWQSLLDFIGERVDVLEAFGAQLRYVCDATYGAGSRMAVQRMFRELLLQWLEQTKPAIWAATERFMSNVEQLVKAFVRGLWQSALEALPSQASRHSSLPALRRSIQHDVRNHLALLLDSQVISHRHTNPKARDGFVQHDFMSLVDEHDLEPLTRVNSMPLFNVIDRRADDNQQPHAAWLTLDASIDTLPPSAEAWDERSSLPLTLRGPALALQQRTCESGGDWIGPYTVWFFSFLKFLPLLYDVFH